MGNSMKRFLAMALAIVMVVGMMPSVAFAAETEAPKAVEQNTTDGSKQENPEPIADGNVAKVGETGYKTLAEALAAATAGQTITFVADVTEDVTVTKAVTIDGAGKTYTGKMTVGSGLTVTIQNVNFVNAGVVKATKSSAGIYTIKNCTFDGNGGRFYYPLQFVGANKLTIEDCTAINYSYFLYVQSAANVVTVKNVMVDCPGYAVYFASGVNTATIENLTVKNSTYGLALNDSANRAFTIKNVTMENVVTPIYGTTGKNTINCDALGVNDFGVGNNSQNVKISAEAQNGNKIGSFEAIAADAKSGETVTLLADYTGEAVTLPTGVKLDDNGKAGADKITEVKFNVVVTDITREDGTSCNDQYFATIYEALDFIKPRDTATIKLLEDFTITADQRMFSNYSIVINAEYITLDLNGKTMLFDYEGNTVTCYASFAIYNKGTLTIKDSSEEKTGTIYSKNKIQGNDGPRILWITSAGSATIEGGNFISEQGDTMFYTSNSNKDIPTTLYIKGGYFEHTIPTSGETYRYFNQQNGYQKQIIEISGGIFKHNPTDTEIEFHKDFKLVENADGTYGVTEKNYVAQIGEQGYESLKEALAAATAGQTITFLADITEDVTISTAVTINGAGKTYTGKMTLKADTTIKNVNFDGKGYNGYAIETRGANYLTIEDCTAKNYGYGFVQLASATALTTVKNVTVSNMNYGVKVDYSNAVVLENVDITAAVAAVLNSNYGSKTITIKDSKLSILGTWTRNNTIKTTYVFEGANTIDSFITDAAIDNFKLALGATLTAPNEITVTTVEDYEVKYENGVYASVEAKDYAAKIGNAKFESLQAAIEAAQAGEIVTLLRDVTMSEILVINKAITLDGNGHTLTSTAARAINIDTEDKVVISNLTIDAKGERAVNIINKAAIVELNKVSATAKNYAIMIATSAGAVNLTVNNSDLTGLNVVNVAGAGAQVAINNTKITNVDATKVENYAAIAVYYTALNAKITVNGGKVVVADDSVAASIGALGATVTFNGTEGADKVEEGVAYISYGDYAYIFSTLEEAIEYAKAGETIVLLRDVTISSKLVINKSITIDGNGKTITYTGSDRAIDIPNNADAKVNVTIENLTVDCTASYCQRGINYNDDGALTLNNVTVKGTNVTYALNLPGSSDNCVVTITDSSLTGNIALNVWGEKATINATNTTFTAVDNNTVEGYASVKLNNDGATSAEGTVINITGGKIDVTGSACADTEAASNGTSTGKINISESTVVNGEIAEMVAVIRYANGTSYSFTSLADAIAKAEAGDTITLLRDVNLTEILTINKAITLDGNGKTLTSTAARAINVSGADGVTIKNLTINASGERAINVINGATNVTIENVTATAANYTVNVASSAANAVVAIKNSKLTGLNVVNVAAPGAKVTVTGGTLICNDQTDVESYAALAIATNASKATITATGVTFDIKGDSAKAGNGTTDGTITIDGVEVGQRVAMIQYANGTAYTFSSLAAAVAKAEAGETVVLLRDVTITELIKIEKAITIDLNGHKVTATSQKAFEVYANAIIKNGTIEAAQRCVDTRKAVELTLIDVSLIADKYTTHGNPQPLTIGGSENGTKVTMTNVNISAAAGYGIITFVKTELTATKSTIGGYNALYVKPGSENSTFNFVDCDLSGSTAGNDVEGNSFSTIAVRANNVTVNVDAASTVNASGNYCHAISLSGTYAGEESVKGAVVTVAGAINGKILANLSGNTVTVKAEYADELQADGYATKASATEGLITVSKAVAQIGENYYASLSDAIKAAKDGETITFLADITENVTISKSVTINGDEFKYTGKMTVNAGLTVTVQNVNFVNGGIDKPNAQKSTTGKYTITNCTFDGEGVYAYAFRFYGANTVTIEKCTVKNYLYSFLYVPSAAVNVSVMDVTVENCPNYAVYFASGVNNATFENLTVKNSNNGFIINNTANRAFTIKNVKMENVGTAISESKGTNTITCTIQGENDFGTAVVSEYAKVVLIKDATLTAPEGITATTDVKDYKVTYEDGTYKLVKAAIAMIGKVEYSSLQEAVDAAKPGATIKLICDAEGAGVVINKNITIDFCGYTYTLTEGVGSTGTESNGIQILKGTTVTLRNGTLKVADSAADKFYILIQNYSDKLTLNNMVLDGRNLDKWSKTDGDSYVLSNNSGKITVNSKTKFIVNNDGNKAFAFDVCDKTSWGYALPTITVSAAKAIYKDENTLVENYKQYIEAVAVISNTYYATLQQAVDMGGTVNLFCDVAGAGVVISKDVNINFGNFTYTITSPVGSTGTVSNGFQILKDTNVVLRNGTIKVADTAADKFYILIQNYSDSLSMTYMTLDGRNLDKWSTTDGDSYTLSNNSGKVTIGAGTKIIANNDGALAFAFDACDKSAWGYELPVVTVNKTAVIEGNIEAAAKVGNVYYATLQQAIDAAANKQTVTVVNDINLNKVNPVLLDGSYNTYFKVEGKSITIDLNGKTISGKYTDTSKMLVGVFSTENDGHLTLTGNGTVNLIEGEGATVYSLMSNYDNDCTITIENGTYTLNSAKDCLLHSSCDKGLIIKGGNFELGNVAKGHWTGNRGNGSPWIFNVNGQNTGAAVVSGGTYNFNVGQQHWAHEVDIVDANGNLGLIKDNGDGTWTVGGTAQAAIKVNVAGNYDHLVGYETLTAALAAAKPAQPVLLMQDIVVEKSIAITGNRNVVIDLNGHTLSSAKAHVITCYYTKTTITIKDSVGGGKVLTTGSGKHAFVIQSNLIIDGAEVGSNKGGNAIVAQTANANVTIQNGAVINGKVVVKAGKLTVTSGTFNDKLEITAGVTVAISGGYFKYPVKAEWCAEGYVPTERLDNGYYSVMNDGEAMIGDQGYATLQEAIKAAQDGDTIKVMKDIAVDTAATVTNSGGYATIYNVAGKAITIDLNGKKINVTVNAADVADDKNAMLLGVFAVDTNGSLILTGKGSVTANAVDASMTSDDSHLYSLMIVYGAGGKLKVNNGEYSANSVSASLVYSQYDDVVIIEGGSYRLGNVGTDKNGSPWIFNAKGQNTASIIVNGGSFNADIQHQHYPFEVQMSEELALKNENGIYTVVPAVAYVTEREWSSKWYTNNVGYATLEEAIAACEGPKTRSGKTSEQEVVVLLTDIALTDTLTIAAGKTVVLDLNGKTISQTKECTASYEMIANNGNLTIKDSVGTGKIVLTDTGAGDPNFGWGSYTVRNSGTLVVDGGTIEFVGNQKFAEHCSQAIFQYSGSTTINGGKIINNAYRSVRLWKGTVTINDGTFEGQVWVQCVDNSAKLTINGGSFAPAKNGRDASSVFVSNATFKAELSITGGDFATKVGANNVNALAGCITGGVFSEAAKKNTASVLFAENMK